MSIPVADAASRLDRVPTIKDGASLQGLMAAMALPNEREGGKKTAGLRAVGRALVHRNFRLFFFGQGVSLIGTWMQQIAMIWLVYELSNSPFLLGLVGFCSQIPAFMVAPLAGVLTDRWNRHRTVLVTQTLAMTQAFVLMGLVLTGTITIWQIFLLSIFSGFVNAFDMPTRQSFLVQMVDDKDDLPNAIALNSSMFNAARLIGPSIAGVVIGWLGEWPCFLLNGVSYLAVIVSLLAMRVKPIVRPRSDVRVLRGLKEGVAYAAGSRPIVTLLCLLSLVSMTAMPLTVLMPVVATDVLHGGPGTLGMLTAASGAGALAASLFLASRTSVLGLGRLIAMATGAFGLGMVGLSLSRMLWLSLAALALTGFAMIVQMAASNTILQTIVDEDKRGRVMSFYTMAFFGTGPLGSLLAGGLASRIGTPGTILACGLVCLAGSLVFAGLLPGLRRNIRPIYVQAGILPEIIPAIDPTAASPNPSCNE
jgi:MFS family permease